MNAARFLEMLERRGERNQIIRGVVQEAINILNEDEDEDLEVSTRRQIQQDRLGAHERLQNDYFVDEPVYGEEVFRRRFRMSKRLFVRIVEDLEREFQYFQWAWDARGRKGLSPHKKCTAAIRQLAYGVASDVLDEYTQMTEKTAQDAMNKFYVGIISLYGKYYLRRPTVVDLEQLYHFHSERHGLVGMLGSIDCTHWDWQNCPVAWQWHYTRGDHGKPTIILQVVASQDLWFWHAYFGVAGSNNDINVLNYSPILNDQAEGRTPSVPFTVNGATYRHGYYLADGIYPRWSIFVKAFTCPLDEKRQRFKRVQESARKDIERAFGVLKQRWHILHYPARAASPRRLKNIMYACIILHNMILEDEGHAISTNIDQSTILPHNVETNVTEAQRRVNVAEIKNELNHEQLRADLVEYLAQLAANEEN